MGQSKQCNDAVPEGKLANENDASTFAAPDLGGSFEEHGQVRRHDGIGAAPGLQTPESLKAAELAEKNSSAGS